jgi:sec-independent protein translocase protein TatC
VLFGARVKVPLQIIAPAEAFLTYLKVSFLAGVFLALPFILYQLWKFVAPGLLEHEKKYTVPFIVGSTALFYAGGVTFYLLLPMVIDFLLSFASEDISAQLSVGYYVSFCLRLMIAFGVVFQLPMVVVFLTQLELLSSHILIKYFRYAVVLVFVVAAVLTPPDVVSQTFMALPMLALYGVSILLARRIEKRREQRQLALEVDD